MDKFDRELQKLLLTKCVLAYPDFTNWQLFPPEIMDYGEEVLSANIIYLYEHKLISMRDKSSDDPYRLFDHMRATASGIDFILDDGGLGAILNVQTIKFHREAVVVLEDLISISNMTEREKDKAKLKLSEMTTEAINAIVQTVTTLGITALFK